ncbi:MAG: hypothetical protein HY905_07220 [Deltaproteobacteria bacterium]|nr:hypothetical protein [Deltaproteobacteria bacterium]
MKKVLQSLSWRVRLGIVAALLAAAVAIGVLVVQAEPVPRTFAYQGVLTDDAGSPITGPHAITMRVFADATTTSALCAESETVTVTGGLFRMTVGDGGCAVDPSWFTRSAPVFLELTVGTTTLAPRTPLLPVASAYQAEHAETAGRVTRTRGTKTISVGGVYCGATAATSGSVGGYSGAKALCETACADPVAHMCSTEEVTRSAALGVAFGAGWYVGGERGYAGLCARSETGWSYYHFASTDCDGWTSSDAAAPVGLGVPGLPGIPTCCSGSSCAIPTGPHGACWSSGPSACGCDTTQPVLCCS